MAPPRLTSHSSEHLERLHRPIAGHIAKAGRRTMCRHVSQDMVASGAWRDLARHVPWSVRGSDSHDVPVPPSAPVPPSPALPSVRTSREPVPLTDAQLVGAAIAPDDLLGWSQALQGVGFALEELHWLPSDFQTCGAAHLTAAQLSENAGDFLNAGKNYTVAKIVLRYAQFNLFAEGSPGYVACDSDCKQAKAGAERCARGWQGFEAGVAAATAAVNTPQTPEMPVPTALPAPTPAPDPMALALQQMPSEIRALVLREIESAQSPFGGSEAAMAMRWVEWCAALPWNKPHAAPIDVNLAQRILDAEHRGLEKVKARILEEIAVQKRIGGPTGNVLCLVGPPGVGKTSVVRSIARALNKPLLRQALGGVTDEMEIRGNNRAYTGAQPGRIIRAMRDAGCSDPVFLLDEVDKIVRGTHHGDPASALLETLDPEQNHAFKDAYLGFPYDLSKVTFIATANYLDDIPPALRDRLEIITLSGYTPMEKQGIARDHLVPKQMAKTKLADHHLRFDAAGLAHLVKYYTQEAGVRELEQRVTAICRKVVTGIEAGTCRNTVTVTPETVDALLGPRRYHGTTRLRQRAPGVVNGLAWTSVGGVMLPVEVRAHARASADGGGRLVLTGNVKKVMEESASIAQNFLRTTYPAISESMRTQDLYIHLPSGAVQKDGPSGGVTLVTAMTAALTKHAVPDDTAMTGEVELFGQILPVGGIKEKAIAAYSEGCKRLFLPKANAPDLDDVPQEVKDNVEIILVEHCSELLAKIFGDIAPLSAVTM